jgi:uncharacterized protein (DUF302 family)
MGSDAYDSLPARGSVPDTVVRATELISARGLTLFATIDQAAAARGAGTELRATVLLIFGSPAAGTPVMQAVPLSALDLPLKLLIWDDDGQTQISYLRPDALVARYGIPPDLAAPLAGVAAIAAAAAA